MKLNRFLLGLSVACLLCMSCSKDEDNGTIPKDGPQEEPSVLSLYDYNELVGQRNHLLKSYSKNGEIIYRMEYDNQRRLISIKGSEGYAMGVEIDYDKRCIIQNTLQMDKVYRFSLNKQGFIDTLACDYELFGNQFRNVLAYEYDGDYLKKASFQFFENGKPGYAGIDYLEATYQYENGLLTTVRYGDVTWEFTYGEIINPDRLSPVGCCPLMVFRNMPNNISLRGNDLLYYTGLFGKVSDKMPDRLLFYTDYVYDFIHNHIEEYQKNKDFYDHNVIEYAFTYMTDEDGILSMSVFRPVYKEFDPPYNYAFQYEK